MVTSTDFKVETGADEVAHDITEQCREFVRASGVTDGILHAWTPHATAGFAVLEEGERTPADLLSILKEILPVDGPWTQRSGKHGHNRDHVLPALIPPFASIPIVDGELGVGRFQTVRLVDTNKDNPVRTVRLTAVG